MSENYVSLIIDLICFKTIYHLEVPAVFPYLIHLVHSVRKALADSVVCYRYRAHSPLVRLLYYLIRGRNSVHCGHIGMAVELHPFYRCVINLGNTLDKAYILRLKVDFLVIGVKNYVSGRDNSVPSLYSLEYSFSFLDKLYYFERYRALVIGQDNRNNHPLAVLGSS